MLNRVSYLILLGVVSTVMASAAVAQAWSYSVVDNTGAGQNPGGLNTESDGTTTLWNQILAGSTVGSTNQWSAAQTMPFSFDFYGQPVTGYKVSANGVLTFDTTAVAVPGANQNLPTTGLPDNSIAIFWDEFAVNPPIGTTDDVDTKVFGTAPNRQLWVKYYSYEIASRSYAYWALVLEETTNKIYIVDMGYYSGSGTTTVGVQLDSTTAVQFGSNNIDFVNSGTTATGNGYYEFTPFQLVDELVPTGNPVSGFTASGDTGVVLGAFDLEARNTAAQAISSLTLTQSGSTSSTNVTNATLWHDQNSNGVVDTGEPMLGSTVATLTGDTATFTGAPLLNIAAGTTESIIITGDIGAGVSANQTVGFEISASGDITTSPGPVNGTFPVDGGSLGIVVYSATLPFVEDFDGASLASNVGFVTAPGDYPTSTGVGSTPTSASTTANGTALVTNAGNATPQSGTDYVWTWHASQSAVAIDTRMDLSAYNVATDTIEFRFSYWVDGLDTTYSQYNYAFVSVDGGQTWVDTLFDIDELAPSGWQLATVDLSAALSAAGSNFTNRVVLRVQVADNLSTDYTYFEDIGVREIPASLEVGGGVAPNSSAPFAISPSGDIPVLDLALTANLNDQTVSDITVTNSGTVADADITDVKLWQDTNDNGVVDTGESQLGTTQTFGGGTATFSTLNLLITAGTTENLLVTYAFVAGATGSIGCEIASSGDITSTPDPVQAAFGLTFPVGGTLGDLLEPIAALPYSEDFDGSSLAKNVGKVVAAGTYPTASSIGGTTATDTTTNDGELVVAGTTAGTAPNSSPNQVVYSFGNGQAVAAMDFHFDLSGYSAASDQIEFSFAWTDDGLDTGTTNEPFDYVFVSTDGGATWQTAVFFIDPGLESSTTSNTYSSYSVDISAILNSVGANYTNNMVIRVQAADTLSSDYLMVDDVQLELIPPTAPTIGDPAPVSPPRTVLITEVAEDPGSSFNEFIELTNVSNTPVDMTGWILYFWDNGSTAAPAGSVALSSTLAAGATFLAADVSSDTYFTVDAYLGTGVVDWDDCGVVLVDGSNNIVDAAFFGPIDPTQITNPFSIGTAWSGATASAPLYNGPSQERTGSGDNDDASNWVASSNAPDNDSIGVLNSGLSTPFSNYPVLQISGTNPTYSATVDLGGDLDFQITANDVNTQDTLTWTVTDLGTGSLSAAQAGFDQTFTAGVYNDPNPNQAAPHSLQLTGIAMDTGTVNLQLDVSDGTFTTSVTLSITIQLGSPVVRVDNIGNMDFFTYSAGTPSVFTESFDVSGYALTNDIVITAPTDFEVSTSATGGFGASVSLTPTGTNMIVAATTIHVRYNPITAGPHAQVIDVDSTGATTISIDVTGDIIPQTAPVLDAPATSAVTNPIQITEMDLGTTDLLEIQNVSATAFDATGWQIIVNGSTYSNINTPETVTYTLGNFAAGEVLSLTESTAGPNYFGASFFWNPGVFPTLTGWAMIVDTTGTVREFVALNWPAVDIAGMSVDAGGFTGLNPSNVWSGDGVDISVGGDVFERVGSADSNSNADWQAASTATGSFGTTNPGLNVPFGGGTALIISGTAPNYIGSAYIGDNLDLDFNATDVNTLETLTFTVTVTGGTLTAAQAGFNQTFTAGVFNDPSPGQTPHSLSLTGTAAQAGTLDLTITVEDSTALQDTYDIAITILPRPTLTATGTLTPFFAPAIGTPSPEQSITVSGVNLVGDLVVTAPAEFEVSLTSGSGFGGNIAIPPAGGSVAATTVFVRFNPTSAGPLLAQPLDVESLDATPFMFDLDGYVSPFPTLSVSLTPLTTFSTDAVGNPSAEQVFNIDATDLVGDITVTAPAEFEVSLTSGVGFSNSVTIPQAVPFSTTTVFVRYNPSAAGPHTGNITVSSIGPVSATVAVNGDISGGGGSSSGGGGGGDGGGGCVAGTSNTGMWGVLLGALALLIIALRVRAVRE